MIIDKYEFIYNSNSVADRKLYAQLQAEDIECKEVDIYTDKSDLTAMRLKEIADGLEIPVHQLIHPQKAEQAGLSNYDQFSEADTLTLIENNLEVLDTPFVIKGQSFYRLAYANSFKKLKDDHTTGAADSDFFQQ